MFWRRFQRVAFWLMVGGGILAVASAIGATPGAPAPAAVLFALHAVSIGYGFACGLAAVARSREIDRERWRVLGDPAISSGEREYAHREAEAELRSAGRVLVLSGVALGAVGAYQLREPGKIGAADLLIVTPLAGFALGLLAGRRLFPAVLPGG
jgi:hypothetical protein